VPHKGACDETTTIAFEEARPSGLAPAAQEIFHTNFHKERRGIRVMPDTDRTAVRQPGTITTFFHERQFGFITSKEERIFFHVNSIRPDAIGRREFYCRIGAAVSFVPISVNGSVQASNIVPDAIQDVDPATHTEFSTLVELSDDCRFGFLERFGGDNLYFNPTAALLPLLAIGCRVQHRIVVSRKGSFVLRISESWVVVVKTSGRRMT
jgi:cold shock CspA family protein